MWSWCWSISLYGNGGGSWHVDVFAPPAWGYKKAILHQLILLLGEFLTQHCLCRGLPCPGLVSTELQEQTCEEVGGTPEAWSSVSHLPTLLLAGSDDPRQLALWAKGRAVLSSTLVQGVRWGNFPLYLSWVLVAVLIIKLTQDRLTGEKVSDFNMCALRSHKWDLRSGQSRQLF